MLDIIAFVNNFLSLSEEEIDLLLTSLDALKASDAMSSMMNDLLRSAILPTSRKTTPEEQNQIQTQNVLLELKRKEHEEKQRALKRQIDLLKAKIIMLAGMKVQAFAS